MSFRHPRRGNYRSLAAGVTVLAMVAAACGGDDDTSTATTAPPLTTEGAVESEDDDTGAAPTDELETYTIGLGMPFSGASAFLGEEYQAMVEYGIADVNEQYAADGIQLELIAEDTQATAEVGVSAANKLIAVDGAIAVITAWSGVQLAMAPVAGDLGAVVLGFGQSPALRGADPNMVNLAPLSDVQGRDLSEYIVNELGATRVAMIYVDSASGQGAADSMREEIEALGGEIVASESIRENATDAAVQVAVVANSNPDMIYVHTLLVEGTQVFREISDQGLDVPIASYAGIGESRVIRDASAGAMDGMLYASHMPEDVEAVRDSIFARFEADHPDVTLEGQSYDPYAYSAPFLIAESIKDLRAEGREVNGAGIRDVIRTRDSFDLPLLGTVSYGEDLTISAPTVILQINDSAANPVTDSIISVIG